MMDKMQSCQLGTPQLCNRCQEFYGSPQNHGLCSKFYQDLLKEKIVKSAATICFKKTTASPSSSPSVSKNLSTDPFIDAMNPLTVDAENNPPIVKNRCESCNKKVGLAGFGRKCGRSFCGMHGYPEEHACKLDYKTGARLVLMKENPVSKGDKLFDRA